MWNIYVILAPVAPLRHCALEPNISPLLKMKMRRRGNSIIRFLRGTEGGSMEKIWGEERVENFPCLPHLSTSYNVLLRSVETIDSVVMKIFRWCYFPHHAR